MKSTTFPSADTRGAESVPCSAFPPRRPKHGVAGAAWLSVLAGIAAGCVSASESPIRLNEVLPSNSNGCADEVGERNDWVELYNTSDSAVDLDGYSLTDDTASPRKAVISGGVTIPAQSALLFWCDDTPDQGKQHLAFKLKAKTEQVVLYDAEERKVDQFRWTDTSTDASFSAYSDISYARVPDGTGNWVRCGSPTCGEDNSASCGN